ncbi:hypothetical protein Pcac1_g5483 [Phytophthora cactorum]|nr:hypothetical protein Pcac1_g5483 [Phytophthora cactorum]
MTTNREERSARAERGPAFPVWQHNHPWHTTFRSATSALSRCSYAHQVLLLKAFVKFDNLYEELSSIMQGVHATAASNMNLENQKHAYEYPILRHFFRSFLNGEEVLRAVLEYPEKRKPGLDQQKPASSGDGAVLQEEGAVYPRAPVRVSKQPAATDEAVDVLPLEDPVATKTLLAFVVAGYDAIRGPNLVSSHLREILDSSDRGLYA